MMRRRILRLLLTAMGGLVLLVGGVWLLSRALNDHEPRFEGQIGSYWTEQLTNRDAGVRQRAIEVLNRRVIPYLTNQIVCDTNDSQFRLTLIEQLNNLPGIQISFTPNEGRRAQAISDLGQMGSHAQSAIPILLDLVRRNDELLCGAAAGALVQLQAEPEQVIPALIGSLFDRGGRGRAEVVDALGAYGEKARAALPALLKLRQDRSSKDLMVAVPKALKRIDPNSALHNGSN